MNGSVCNVCGKPATVLDTEYDEYYCDEHAQEYQVLDGPHERLLSHEEYVTKSGKVLSEEEIQKLADEAEAGYDVERFQQRYRATGQEPVAPGLESEADVDVWMGAADEAVIPLEGEAPEGENMLEFELTQPLKPWTITLEITNLSRGPITAQDLGEHMLERILGHWREAAGVVIKVEPNA